MGQSSSSCTCYQGREDEQKKSLVEVALVKSEIQPSYLGESSISLVKDSCQIMNLSEAKQSRSDYRVEKGGDEIQSVPVSITFKKGYRKERPLFIHRNSGRVNSLSQKNEELNAKCIELSSKKKEMDHDNNNNRPKLQPSPSSEFLKISQMKVIPPNQITSILETYQKKMDQVVNIDSKVQTSKILVETQSNSVKIGPGPSESIKNKQSQKASDLKTQPSIEKFIIMSSNGIRAKVPVLSQSPEKSSIISRRGSQSFLDILKKN